MIGVQLHGRLRDHDPVGANVELNDCFVLDHERREQVFPDRNEDLPAQLVQPLGVDPGEVPAPATVLFAVHDGPAADNVGVVLEPGGADYFGVTLEAGPLRDPRLLLWRGEPAGHALFVLVDEVVVPHRVHATPAVDQSVGVHAGVAAEEFVGVDRGHFDFARDKLWCLRGANVPPRLRDGHRLEHEPRPAGSPRGFLHDAHGAVANDTHVAQVGA